jgi:hypothetical protein
MFRRFLLVLFVALAAFGLLSVPAQAGGCFAPQGFGFGGPVFFSSADFFTPSPFAFRSSPFVFSQQQFIPPQQNFFFAGGGRNLNSGRNQQNFFFNNRPQRLTALGAGIEAFRDRKFGRR